jgi:hypothetical protein
MRRALLATAFLASALTPCWAARVAPHRAPSSDVALALDEVHTLTFAKPVSTVYVGNPAIADVTMIDSKHAFVQGKGYGRTNIVALNSDNAQVFTSHITVTGNDTSGTVTLNRGAQRVTYNCAGGRCEPTPMPGDAKDAYDAETGQASAHQSAARTAAANDVPAK